jgi:tRNA threonylcarbamoyladenosine biosynthesis protein TsaE
MNQPQARCFHEEILPDEASTARAAARLAGLARKGDVIALFGDLGAGKTAFARAFINALKGLCGAAAEEEVPSPTFTLVQIYDRLPAPVWHFDLYRIEEPEEVWELGFEEALAEAITLIEWPERLGALLPGETLRLELEPVSGKPRARRLRLSDGAGWPRRWRSQSAAAEEGSRE